MRSSDWSSDVCFSDLLVLKSAALDDVQQLVDIRKQYVRCAGELHGQAGVEHVGAGHALMHESGGFPHMFGHVGQESDDVVLDLRLYGVDALDLQRAFIPDRRSSLLRHHAQFGKNNSGMRLDFEPDTKFGIQPPGGNTMGQEKIWEPVTNPH